MESLIDERHPDNCRFEHARIGCFPADPPHYAAIAPRTGHASAIRIAVIPEGDNRKIVEDQMFGFGSKTRMTTAETALAGRDAPIPTASRHAANGHPLHPPYPAGLATALFGMGCFWGAERLFWPLPGVHVTAVGYAGGFTPHPTYEEVCSGRTGHTEAVLVVFDPARIGYAELLRVFWEGHDPTQFMRQGNDVGTQYRSAIYTADDAQAAAAAHSARRFQAALDERGLGRITTEIAPAPPFYFAEAYHQQYLHKNPGGYCGLGGTGACLPPEAATAG
jgi:peptide-methionine (S)-S-oxide reductase